MRHYGLRSTQQQGFALLVSMLVLLLLTIFVVNAVRNSMLQEKMSGSYMDRNRALQVAEQAMRQAESILAKNAQACLDQYESFGCTVTGTLPNPTIAMATGNGATSLPATWTDTNAVSATLTSAQSSAGQTAKFVVTWLAPGFVPADKSTCKAYSIMGRGTGIQSTTVVVLQSVAYVCSV